MPVANVEIVETIRELYDRGLYLQAYERSKQLGSFRERAETSERIILGRLAQNLGGVKLGRVLHLLAVREDPEHPEAAYYGAYAIAERRGLLSSWEYMERLGDLAYAPQQIRADWIGLRAHLAARLRDFDTSYKLIDAAHELAPDHAWLMVEHASIMQAADRYADALEWAEHALDLRPWFRPGVQCLAHSLVLVGRDQEALELLTKASNHLESSAIVAQLADLHCELGNFDEHLAAWERFAELTPLRDERGDKFLAGRMYDAAYRCGDYELADEWATKADEKTQKLSKSAANSSGGKRMILPVAFVRQHHMTCAPAILTSLAQFWETEVDHLDLAEKICYDGTPHHSQREWAEQNGWAVREFTINWDNSRALIDRGVPFTLTTVDPGNAHLQAVIGYDSRRRTLIIRDPYCREQIEYLADEALARYASTGPRGMAIVPKEKSELLDGLEFADATLYDCNHRLQCALIEHNRDTAENAFNSMKKVNTDHALTLRAALSIAEYDADTTERLEAIESLLSHFPEDANLILSKFFCLRELSRRKERLDLLRTACDEPEADPLLFLYYAQELSEDIRENGRAEWLLRRAIRCRPGDGSFLNALARVLWTNRKFEKARQFFRLAACLDDHSDSYARHFFTASRFLNRTEEAVSFLRHRVNRFQDKSSGPARTLFGALGEVGRLDDAFAVLEDALERRPNDQELVLYAADAYARFGKDEKAVELLEQTRQASHPSSWLRTAAALSSYRGDLSEALNLWRALLDIKPLAIDAHQAVANLLTATECHEAARTHLEKATTRFPHHFGLHQLLIEFLNENNPNAAEPVLRKLIEIHPVDGWAHRELALTLRRLQRLDDAVAAADMALQVDSASSASHSIRASLARSQNDRELCRELCRKAIRLSVDDQFAVHELIESCASVAERRTELEFIRGELLKQVIMGDGLLTFRVYAHDTLDADELLAVLDKALEARGDLWHAWSAVIHQLLDMGQTERAVSVAEDAVERFSLIPRMWFDLSQAYLAERDLKSEQKALEKALAIQADYGPAIRQLALAYERRADIDASRRLLEQAVAHSPLEATHHGCLADILWKQGEKDAAIKSLQKAVVLEPDYGWAWDTLLEWTYEIDQPSIAIELARELTERRGGEPRSWIILSQLLNATGASEEAVAAINTAIKLDPHRAESHDEKARLLALAGCVDEAFAAAKPEEFSGQIPILLRGREAWIHAIDGNLTLGILGMEAVVTEDPSYYAGWQWLAEWYDHTENLAAYEKAVTEMVRLAPSDVFARGHLADAKRRLADRVGAKTEFRRALDSSPDYWFAGAQLFEMHLEDDELDEADETLAVLKAHQDSPQVLALELKLRFRQEDQDTAVQVATAICANRTANRWTLNTVAEEMLNARLPENLEETLLRSMSGIEPNPLCGALWVEHFAREHESAVAESHLKDWQGLGDDALPAVAAYLELLAEEGKTNELEALIERERDALHGNDTTWTTVGSAFSTLDQHQKVCEWLADWEERPGATPYALLLLALSQRKVGTSEDMVELSRKALRLEPDCAISAHNVLLSFAEAVNGNTEKADDHLTRAKPLPDMPYYQFLAQLIYAMLKVQRGECGLFGINDNLKCARKIYPWLYHHSERETFKDYKRCVKRLARDCRSWWAPLWRALQWIRTARW